ncbi:hypothetical protein G3142_005093 [Salmonella enterica subsp. enterica serovar Montevideo]|nr:hypothetical protein [Salmonella enterica subsp. enterica serovar Montevideo]EEK7813673.1 hypothetical protein [Salmonella enterica subsp. enterica serovar Montevideo]
MKKCVLFILALTASTAVSAVGVPLIDLAAPIKVSESSGYRCGTDGKGYVQNDGEWQPINFRDGDVTCHDDRLWFKGKPMSFNELLSQTLKDYQASK